MVHKKTKNKQQTPYKTNQPTKKKTKKKHLNKRRFQNKTNGVTQRRWLAFCNPPLRRIITQRLGSEAWIRDLNLVKASALALFWVVCLSCWFCFEGSRVFLCVPWLPLSSLTLSLSAPTNTKKNHKKT